MSNKKVHRQPIRKTALALIGELGSESNAHGVARIVRSRDSRRKVLWSLMVLFGVGAAISQLSSLLHKYLQYQVVEVSEIQDGLPVEFPSVTVCNIEPISWRKLRELLNGTTSNNSDVRGWLEFLENFDFGPQEPHLRSIRAFHENVGEDAMYVRHSLNESLLHCRFNKQSCSTANFTTSFDGNYYSCFTFNTQPPNPDKRLIVHSTGPEHGLSVVMFLDNNFPPLGSYGVYTLDTNILHSAGARVMVHAPNTLPIPVQHGQDVAPGFSTSVSIKPLLHARLPQPYGNCSDTHLRGLTNFTSTFSTCIAVCKQEVIVKSCGCRSSALPQIPALSNVPYCGHVDNWRSMLRNKEAYNRSLLLPRLQCEVREMERLKNDRGYETNCGCTHPCWELSYHMSTSMSYWPTELYQYDALIQMYGEEGIKDSPLSRAYRLHDSNIKDGEAIIRQISQQGQPLGNFSEPDESAGNHQRASTGNGDSQSQESGQSAVHKRSTHFGADSVDADTNRTLNGTETNSQSNSTEESSGSEDDSNPDLENQQQQPLLEYNNQQLDNLREASTEIRQNMLRLNVYLEDLSVVKYKQMPAYGMEDLFADIGGTLGLWMGVSVLTMMEVLELIVRLSHLFLRAEWKPSASEEDDEQCDKGSDREWELRDRDRFPFEDQQRYKGDQKDEVKSNDSESDGDTRSFDRGHPIYSYRSVIDCYRSDALHSNHGLFEANGHSASDAQSPDVVNPPSKAGYSGRTKYWRLKKGKSKR